MQFYVNKESPEKTMEDLGWLASCSDNLLELLESYRYLQPDNKPFSAETIDKISRIHLMQEEIAYHVQERDEHAKMIKLYEYEIDCIEKRINSNADPQDEF